MRTGTLALRRVPALSLRRNTTRIPTPSSVAKMAASVGLPSTVDASAPADPPPFKNHEETGLDPAIQSQATGSQSALEFRVDLSRSRKKSPRIPVVQMRTADQNIIRRSSSNSEAPIGSESDQRRVSGCPKPQV